jgi:hypothetical protein
MARCDSAKIKFAVSVYGEAKAREMARRSAIKLEAK